MSSTYIRSSIILLGVIIFSSCTHSHEVSNRNKFNNKEDGFACSNIRFERTILPLEWIPQDNSILNKSKEVLVLPQEYKVYKVDHAQTVSFFKNITTSSVGANSAVPLPPPADCRAFYFKDNLEKSGTNPEGTYSIIGESLDQIILLDLYNDKMVGKVNWFDITYHIRPVPIDNEYYYVIYRENKNQTPQSVQEDIQFETIDLNPVK